MHRPSEEEFLLALLEGLDYLPPELAQRLAEVLARPHLDRSQPIRQLFEEFAGDEKIQRLVMRAFRGVPGEMVVDLAGATASRSTATTAPARARLPTRWNGISRGRFELLCHEGRQHTVRHVGSDGGTTSVEVVTTGRLGGAVVFPTSASPRRFRPSGERRSFCAGARSPTSSTRPRPRSGKPWSRSSVSMRLRASVKTCSACGTIAQGVQGRGRSGSRRAAARWPRAVRRSHRTPCSRTSSRSAGC